MDNVKLDIKTIISLMNDNKETFAAKTGIEIGHLNNMIAGRCKMWADDLCKICEYTNLPVTNIKTKTKKK